MRLSADRNSSYYHPFMARYAVVLLNGADAGKVVEADEENGTVRRYLRDTDGKLIISEDGRTCLTETVVGRVEITFNRADADKMAAMYRNNPEKMAAGFGLQHQGV